MAFTLNAYDRQRRLGTYQYVKTMTQSTSTTPQAVDLTADVVVVGMGTATGSSARNIYSIGSGVEGQELLIYALATGEACIRVDTAFSGLLPANVTFAMLPTATAVDALLVTATGMYILQAANEYVLFRWMNAAWHTIEARGATFGTTT